jgi:hypothetical protein
LARSEEEVCRELVLRIPVSENLRRQIARQALETVAQNEDSPMPVSDLHQADASANQSARVEMPPYLVSAPDQPVNGVESAGTVRSASFRAQAAPRALDIAASSRLSIPRSA